jgi:ketosteroid isomerase-like protein
MLRCAARDAHRAAGASGLRLDGVAVDEEQVQWGSFDDAGRIVSLRHYEDTAAVRDAWR